ncbi:PD-(D/E)XK nuclease family protein [Bifidobacterium imperatoris]|uniref:ATP-dependent DNA helicase UvrD n=1 Tax=Bifidobacterium imperatoris TaxID=2020965 RepID=A0A2N5IR36_9BIFI|nr:PD-(D/E)XK nuclease family protein [Bifidobacterium imperatoris]PLS24418.1 ATP-dependent DNA helicase UvrD [Bifidobacterium imperatoris]QSY58029.1 PD-(D/E)XK nuclease family protein [Bifidobacterium imperatoris]
MSKNVNPSLLLDGIERDGAARLVIGVPGAGKTEYALALLLEGLRRYGDAHAVMTVSGRIAADQLGNRVIRERGFSTQARPVTTLGAVAFRVIAASRSSRNLPAPRLLNGAEQDMLLRQVMAVHMSHVIAGDECVTCLLLSEYFAQSQWASLIMDPSGSVAGGSTSAEIMARGISDAFISQLRDMLARLDELGVGPREEPSLIQSVAADSRLSVQWRLAFALRAEYIRAQVETYADQYRLDASYLLVAGAREVQEIRVNRNDLAQDGPMRTESDLELPTLPRLIVVDDAQDITLAGMRFLEELHQSGTAVVLVGNPDEAVQTFRGSYPEYLMRRACSGPLNAAVVPLGTQNAGEPGKTADYAHVVASRVSLSISSEEEEELPPAKRPGKLTAALRSGMQISAKDDSVLSGLYRSSREELDDVVWRIKRAHLDQHVRWNDMAVIAHDNATVRVFGERLRRDGVPVRYSSVTRPLKDEPCIQGLFALVELALLRVNGINHCNMTLAQIASYVRARVRTLMNGPLITSGKKPGQGGTARLAPIESAMNALESLSTVSGDEGALFALMQGWHALSELADSQCMADSAEDAIAQHAELTVDVDDALVDADSHKELAFGVDALYVMLALDESSASAQQVLASIHAVLGNDVQAQAFMNLWNLVDRVSEGLRSLPEDQRDMPSNALSIAWQAVGVASAWQKIALANTPDGRASNDRLDAVMRLFQFAEDATASNSIVGFITQVRNMQVQADSLAHVGPVEDAVSLTTPAGAAGRHWPYVWIVEIEQDVWPNLAGRNTMFGGEELAELVLRGTLASVDEQGHDPRFVSVLSSEKKSFLVSLTRASKQVYLSAVWNDDASPSDFLFGYLPEHYSRNKQEATFTSVGYSESGQAGETEDSDTAACAGLDGSPRDLVAAARASLVCESEHASQEHDAATALGILAAHGIEVAHPDNWAFTAQGDSDMNEPEDERAAAATATENMPVVTLSPSAVDGLWACPVCWLLEHQFAGPQPGSVNAGFGTLIHAVAQQGSEEHLDRLGVDERALQALGLDASSSREQRIQTVSDRLMALYEDKRPDPNAVADTRERYQATRKDDAAADMLHNIADYFVTSAEESYLGKNFGKFNIGALHQVDCELQFAARFDLNDILAAYNAIPGVAPIDCSTLLELMGMLVGGWPEGMCENLIVRLSGRMDRVEHRILADGSSNIRLIDYKTGAVPVLKQVFNDLQLVCYQLGLIFPEQGSRGEAALRKAPTIGQSMLFHVAKNASPAASRAPEGAFQPPLFTDGSLNAEPFDPRYFYTKPDKFYDMPVLAPEHKPHGVSEEAWRQFLSLAGTQAMWSLTMISRVFYAAAASRSAKLDAHPQSTHVEYCRMKHVCPACAGQVDTVFETRQA